MQRKTIFSALVGSHNYNLHNEHSDKDYKAFVLPTFHDLYKGKMYHNSSMSQDVDLDVHDVRRIPNLFWKANINFLEVLFSMEIKVEVGYAEFVEEMFANKERIAAANLPYLYNACVGMSLRKRKGMDKYSESMEYSRQFGYNIKEAAHSFRMLDFLERYAKFGSFADAIWYEKDETTLRHTYAGELIRGIRKGVVSRAVMEGVLDRAMGKAEEYKSWYMEQSADKEILAWLDGVVMGLVEREICR